MNVLVLGASDNPERYAVLAVHNLLNTGHTVWPVGVKEAKVCGLDIITHREPIRGIDIITMYINPDIQKDWYDYIFEVNPKKIIFNPGSENHELAEMAIERGIDVVEACTLILISDDEL
jgi:predicted CoA-binding protein